jgi:hypothetical protein
MFFTIEHGWQNRGLPLPFTSQCCSHAGNYPRLKGIGCLYLPTRSPPSLT